MRIHVCEVCMEEDKNAIYKDDFIIYDEELEVFFCRNHYDQLLQED